MRQQSQRGLIKNGKRLPQVPGICRQSDYPAFSCAKLGRKKDSRNSLQKSKFKRRQKTSTKNSKGFKTLQKASKRFKTTQQKKCDSFLFLFFSLFQACLRLLLDILFSLGHILTISSKIGTDLAGILRNSKDSLLNKYLHNSAG